MEGKVEIMKKSELPKVGQLFDNDSGFFGGIFVNPEGREFAIKAIFPPSKNGGIYTDNWYFANCWAHEVGGILPTVAVCNSMCEAGYQSLADYWTGDEDPEDPAKAKVFRFLRSCVQKELKSTPKLFFAIKPIPITKEDEYSKAGTELNQMKQKKTELDEKIKELEELDKKLSSDLISLSKSFSTLSSKLERLKDEKCVLGDLTKKVEDVVEKKPVGVKEEYSKITVVDKAYILLKSGEKYAGLVVDENGKLSYHLILSDWVGDKLTWVQANARCPFGTVLPSPREIALLFSNLGAKLPIGNYWTAGNGSNAYIKYVAVMASGVCICETCPRDIINAIAVRRIYI